MANTITLNVTNSVSTGATSGYLVIPGDFTSLFYPGMQFTLFDATVVPYPEDIDYTVVSSALVNGNTEVTVDGAVIGSIISISAPTPGTGPFVSGTYVGVALTGGTGTGAQATVVNVGPGPINTFGTLTGGSNYNNGTYSAVPLVALGPIATLGTITGGTGYTDGTYTNVPLTPLTTGAGSGAEATIVVAGGIVTTVTLTAYGTGYIVGELLSASTTVLGPGTGFSVPIATLTGASAGTGAQSTVVVEGGQVVNVVPTAAGTGYAVGDLLTANIADIGNAGEGFEIAVLTVDGTIQSVTLTNAGVSYTPGDVLTYTGLGLGTGTTVTVQTVSSNETGSIQLSNTVPMFAVGQTVYAITAANSPCQIPWWSTVPQYPTIAAVQSASVLGISVAYTNSTTSPTITYSLRIGTQPGVALLDQTSVFVDKPTAIAAYEAMNL